MKKQDNNSDNLPALIDGHIYHRQDSRFAHDNGTYRYDAATNTLVGVNDSCWGAGPWSRGGGFGSYGEGEENYEIWTDITPTSPEVSDWQDGKTLPQFPGLYQRQFSIMEGSIFDAEDDEKNYHYFDGEVWYIYGVNRKDAMREFERGADDRSDKYSHAPWRGLVDIEEESK